MLLLLIILLVPLHCPPLYQRHRHLHSSPPSPRYYPPAASPPAPSLSAHQLSIVMLLSSPRHHLRSPQPPRRRRAVLICEEREEMRTVDWKRRDRWYENNILLMNKYKLIVLITYLSSTVPPTPPLCAPARIHIILSGLHQSPRALLSSGLGLSARPHQRRRRYNPPSHPRYCRHCHLASPTPASTLGLGGLSPSSTPLIISIYLWRERRNENCELKTKGPTTIRLYNMMLLININWLLWSLTSRPLYHGLSPSAPARFHICCWCRW